MDKAFRTSNPKVYRSFVHDLLEWFPSNMRRFPWRRTTSPYRILVTEVFLRKTTARQVNSIYRRFFVRFPHPISLVRAEASEIRTMVDPLGLGAVRTRLLQRLASSLVTDHGGTVPSKREALLRLPGVGQYAANATMCFAFGHRVPLVDVNVIRVVGRVFGTSSTRKRARDDPKLWDFVQSRLLPEEGYREFNMALIDFAALVCRPSRPLCEDCFARSYCEFYVASISNNQ